MARTEKNSRKLDEREQSVLRALVDEYISTGKPVGSRSFVQKYSFSISPATMRNIMYDLEKIGYLMQPHTSAGRTPTDLGYRFYVDSLLENYDFSMVEDSLFGHDFFKGEMELEKIFTALTRMLSVTSKYAGIILTPQPDFTVVKRIELIPLDNNEILVILVTRTGIIINKKIQISVNVTQDELHVFSNYLSSVLCGYALYEIREEILNTLRQDKITGVNTDLALDIAQLALVSSRQPEMHILGIENLLKIPEMVEENRLNSLLAIIEEKNILKNIIEKDISQNGVQTIIGSEIMDEHINGCSMVSTAYKIGNKNVGVVGIIGPTRMDYKKILPLVDYTGRLISDFLKRMSK
jgi:heat-inducible transcriptional repressor